MQYVFADSQKSTPKWRIVKLLLRASQRAWEFLHLQKVQRYHVWSISLIASSL